MAKRKRDYYAVLGVPRTATETEIKRAFRELARKHHPDVASGVAGGGIGDSGEKFREINEAYATLSDKDLRARYDRWGHAEDDGGGLASSIVDTASEIIGKLFAQRAQKQKGGDIRYTIEITFEEAAFGCEKKVVLGESSNRAEVSSNQVRADRRELTVAIGAGTKDGSVKTLRGEGEPGKLGAPAGDLHVMIRVAEHAFRREGHDVRSTIEIGFAQAALGAVLEVPTLDGIVKMRIPEGTQPGRVFRIRGKGIPQTSGKQAQRGDHLVEVTLVVPTELSGRQRELIEELGRTTATSDEPGAPGGRKRLIDRVRSLLDE